MPLFVIRVALRCHSSAPFFIIRVAPFLSSQCPDTGIQLLFF
ncbi:hypothetical protein [Wolbachia endosymbiont (group A) of Agelastica alni]